MFREIDSPALRARLGAYNTTDRYSTCNETLLKENGASVGSKSLKGWCNAPRPIPGEGEGGIWYLMYYHVAQKTQERVPISRVGTGPRLGVTNRP